MRHGIHGKERQQDRVLRLQKYITYLTLIKSTISDCHRFRLTCSLIYVSISSSQSEAAILKTKAVWRILGYYTFTRDTFWPMALLGHGFF